MACGVIYLVPVPIGNLGDITLRALEILKSSSLIACEDTRKTSFLLSQYDIPKPRLISFHKFNEKQREELLFRHLSEGKDLTVVSDAGAPGISDPSAKLVAAAISRHIQVIALPGANALVPAITTCGFETGQFQFVGFLPATVKKRKAKLQEIAMYPFPTVIYEAPHRVLSTLTDLQQACGDRTVSIAREISKLHEEHIYGTISELLASEDLVLKGEFVLVLEGCGTVNKAELSSEELEKQVLELAEKGMKATQIVKEIQQQHGLARSEAYSLVLQLLKSRP